MIKIKECFQEMDFLKKGKQNIDKIQQRAAETHNIRSKNGEITTDEGDTLIITQCSTLEISLNFSRKLQLSKTNFGRTQKLKNR